MLSMIIIIKSETPIMPITIPEVAMPLPSSRPAERVIEAFDTTPNIMASIDGITPMQQRLSTSPTMPSTIEATARELFFGGEPC